jgi:rRNA maturation endonuclease Nob1
MEDRVKKYVNILRCYKCHAFGHMVKICSSPNTYCKTCGSREHQKKECTQKEGP